MEIKLRPLHDLEVLIVEDDEITSDVTRIMCEQIGASSVKLAAHGREGLKLLEEAGGAISLVICDLDMPEIDGLQFLRLLAGHETRPAVIMVSGSDDRLLQSSGQLAKSHGLNLLGAVRKPISKEAIVRLTTDIANHNGPRKKARRETIGLADIQEGLEKDEFIVHYQPKIDVASRRITGAEALVRWESGKQGLVPPGLFIGLCEDNDFIDAITEKVLEKAVIACTSWAREGVHLTLAINLSTKSLTRLALPDEIFERVNDAGLEPNRITLEITENRLLNDMAASLEVLTRLRMKGFSLSIDDFGTGYSSMKQLHGIPFGELKIDRAFVNGATNDAAAHAILASSVDLANRLEMKIVAEGVEDDDDWNTVAGLGCHQVQGYYISKPLPPDEFIEFVRNINC